VWLPVLISTIKKTVRAMSPPCGPPVLLSGNTGVSTRRQVGPPSSAQAPSPRVRPPTAVRAPPSISARHEARERREREKKKKTTPEHPAHHGSGGRAPSSRHSPAHPARHGRLNVRDSPPVPGAAVGGAELHRRMNRERRGWLRGGERRGWRE
jgi:hypothetical protein